MAGPQLSVDVDADLNAPLDGSDVYYAALYVHAARRREITIATTLLRTINEIPLKVSDRGIARTKLDWWAQEADAVRAEQARHRLTQSLLTLGIDAAQLGGAIDDLTTGLDAELGGHRIETRDDQIRWFDATFGEFYVLLSRRGEYRDRREPARLRALGATLELAYTLQNVLPLARRDLHRLPSRHLINAGCTWDDLKTGQNEPAVVALIDREAGYVVEELHSQLLALPRKLRRDETPLVVLARIAAATLREMQDDGCRVWQHRVVLTPLRKLWLAWRNRFI